MKEFKMGKIARLKYSGIGILLLAGITLLGSTAAQQKEPEVPYVPTPYEVVREMLKLAQVDEDDVLYDLGCGDGRIVITAAKEFGCRGVGIDIDPQRIEESRVNAEKEGVSDRVKFIEQDLFEADFREATVVTIYLLSNVNIRLRPKLLSELAPGTRLVSHDFNMHEWDDDDSIRILGDREWDHHYLYKWIIPANASGTWNWTIPGTPDNRRYTLKITQHFQKISGEAFAGDRPLPVMFEDGKIKGGRLKFTLEDTINGEVELQTYEGEINLNQMKGRMSGGGLPGGIKNWTARRDPSTIQSIDNPARDAIKTLWK